MHFSGLDISAEGVLDSDLWPWRGTSFPGVQWIPLAADPEGGEGTVPGTMTVLIRMAQGTGYPAHEHHGPEDVLVLAGGYRDGDGRPFKAGDFVRYPKGSVHAPVATMGSSPCILFSVAHGGTTLVEAT